MWENNARRRWLAAWRWQIPLAVATAQTIMALSLLARKKERVPTCTTLLGSSVSVSVSVSASASVTSPGCRVVCVAVRAGSSNRASSPAAFPLLFFLFPHGEWLPLLLPLLLRRLQIEISPSPAPPPGARLQGRLCRAPATRHTPHARLRCTQASLPFPLHAAFSGAPLSLARQKKRRSAQAAAIDPLIRWPLV